MKKTIRDPVEGEPVPEISKRFPRFERKWAQSTTQGHINVIKKSSSTLETGGL